ncbi:MAG: acyltransferase [Actinomycetota bacterium]|nr:acyltransferase [Actinomycetota bacterium]
MAERAEGSGATLDEHAARTPATRDRYVDFLRAQSILVVVVGHWLIGVIYWQDGLIGTTSAIGRTENLWLATWALQVMPIFFFVGGFANLTTYRSFRRRGDSTLGFVRTRLERLLRPSLIFLAVWAVVQIVLHLADVGRPTTPYLRGMKPPGATVPFGPLWFLGVYAAVLIVSPIMIKLHERFGLAVPVVLVVGAIAADTMGFVFGISDARWANVAFAFLFPHQLGFFYAEGRFTSRRVFITMAAAGLAALFLLTNPWLFGEAGREWFPGIGHYPRSLLGTDVERISNAYPPTLPYLAMAFWSIGVAMLLREPLTRWLQKPKPWKRVIFVNSVIMTLFLWHMTAFLLAVLVLWPLGFGQQGDTTAGWWLERPLWVGVSAVLLTGLVAIFGRFERPRRKAAAAGDASP